MEVKVSEINRQNKFSGYSISWLYYIGEERFSSLCVVYKYYIMTPQDVGQDGITYLL